MFYETTESSRLNTFLVASAPATSFVKITFLHHFILNLGTYKELYLILFYYIHRFVVKYVFWNIFSYIERRKHNCFMRTFAVRIVLQVMRSEWVYSPASVVRRCRLSNLISVVLSKRHYEANISFIFIHHIFLCHKIYIHISCFPICR